MKLLFNGSLIRKISQHIGETASVFFVIFYDFIFEEKICLLRYGVAWENIIGEQVKIIKTCFKAALHSTYRRLSEGEVMFVKQFGGAFNGVKIHRLG